jgi:hypothetical protein
VSRPLGVISTVSTITGFWPMSFFNPLAAAAGLAAM